MRARELHLVVPGPLDQRTGGYLYDARIAAGLGALGWTVVVHSLEGAFPEGDAQAEASLTGVLSGLPEGAAVLLDGLGMGSLPGPLRAFGARLALIGLVHHPLADETGVGAAERERLAALERDALAACAGVIVTSAYTAGRLEAYGVPRERVRVVLPGSDPASAARGPAPGEPPRLLCVGTVTPRKGQDVLVRALARVADLPWSCLCAGSLTRAPAFVQGVLEQVERAGLGGRIAFAGECSTEVLEGLYDQASVFLLPSHYEGYGMALAEALVRGLPVVSTTGGAIPHTVPADAGALVAPGDDRALADALAGLLTGAQGADRRAAMAAAARSHGLALPSWQDAARACARAVEEFAPAAAPAREPADA